MLTISEIIHALEIILAELGYSLTALSISFVMSCFDDMAMKKENGFENR